MAFLDNSGDIILDAVLTDTGRMRLAKGDGSFKITKFALGDDEINYELYNKNHASGSAYYDIEIIQSPVLEAFTNNTSMLKSKLITISKTNLLYLPQIRNNATVGLSANDGNNILTVLVDQTTVEDTTITATGDYVNGYRIGDTKNPIVMDQGIVSNAIGDGDSVVLDADLIETQFMIEIDNRFGKIWNGDGDAQATPSFVDDDNVATYYLSKDNTNGNSKYFGDSGTTMSGDVIAGPRGNRLEFLVGPSVDLNSSTYLFTQLGSTATLGAAVYQIDTTIRITGVTTGYRVDLPVRFVKKQ
jgi:hypothetical protein